MLITLVGGPADGRSYEWKGGDVIEVIKPGPGPVTCYIRHTRAVGPPADSLYRRSIRQAQFFVFQP